MLPPTTSSLPRRSGFTLVELIAVIAITLVLISVGVGLLGNSRKEALKTGSEQFSSLVEQARTSAITRRQPVALAIGEPGTAGTGESCRIGLFELDEWNDGQPVTGRLLERWQTLPDNIAFHGGAVQSLTNVKDSDLISLSWRNGNNTADMPALVFSARGGLLWPPGSESVVVAIGNGTYRNGQATRTDQTGDRVIRVGRVVARAWNMGK